MPRFRLPRVIALAFLLITLLVPVSAASAKATDAFGTGLGAKRATFEAKYGQPKSEKGAADFATGTEYAIPGYKSVYVFWQRDTAARIVLNATNGWPKAKAADIVQRWIPADAKSTGAGGGANTAGRSWVTTFGHSAALAKRFSANTYQQYEVEGKQGDFRATLVKSPRNADEFSTIDIAIGANVTLPTSVSAVQSSSTGKTSTKGDASDYLTGMRQDLNGLGKGMNTFLAIMKQQQISQSDVDQLTTITKGWQAANRAARNADAPAGYEKFQTLYTKVTGNLNSCATNLSTFVVSRGQDKDALTALETDYNNAAKAYNALSDALTAAGY